MITLKNIRKKYKNSDNEVALDNVSISFKEGLIHGIIGISGAGKSTLIRLINRLETYDTGEISVFEYTNLRKLNKESTRMLRSRIGMIFQSDHLLSRKTVIENIVFPISIHRKITEKDYDYARILLDEVGLKEYENRYPSQLSGGQRQRVGIARALINNPSLLLCDEPTSALDVITTNQILNLIKKLASIHKLNVIIVTHDMKVIKEICDTVTVMDQGKIVETGFVDRILYNAKHIRTKSFIREIGFDLDSIIEDYNSNQLLLLKFKESIIKDSIVAQMVSKIQVKASIVYANITPKKEGVMVIYIPTRINEVINFFLENDVEVENVI
jgi:D-methionine transport system ATP-binding protein